MKLIVTELQLPGKISFNYEDLKRELAEKVKEYSSLVYTEAQIQEAKADRANLNRLKKALNDERIRQEREFMKPFDEFKAQVRELCGIVDSASSAIDTQVKAFEDAQKQKKADEIKAYWDSKDTPEWMRRDNPKWLNASYTMKAIAAEIDGLLLQIQKDMDTLDGMGVCFEAVQKYQTTLDLNAALAEDSRIKAQAEEKRKWEEDHAQAQIPMDTPCKAAESHTLGVSLERENIRPTEETGLVRSWVGFQAYLTIPEALELKKYFRERGIKFEAL